MSTVKFTVDGFVTFHVSDLYVDFDAASYDDDMLHFWLEEAVPLAIERWYRTRKAEHNPIAGVDTYVAIDEVTVTTVRDEDGTLIDW